MRKWSWNQTVHYACKIGNFGQLFSALKVTILFRKIPPEPCKLREKNTTTTPSPEEGGTTEAANGQNGSDNGRVVLLVVMAAFVVQINGGLF